IDLSGAAVSEKESLWMMVDIDSIKRSEKNAQDLALSDSLTGIANRRLFDLRLEGALSNARRNNHLIAVCYMDLDGFKKINDAYGHDAGDTVLCQTAKRLAEAVRGNDVVARLGGDEFAVLLNSVEGTAGATLVMQRCLEQIRESIEIAPGKYVQIDASIGIVVGSGDSAPQDLLRRADEMMYAVKKGGKGRIQAVAIKSVSKNTEEVK
ncbi:GGDEF domain-containing protein, partial [Pseudomonas aeruginosa]|nr:GGDEF domain-containing protein [Pseudomonas aeruginosa]ELO0943545.1 GGDEF domain-containing protein [Pseudomonas aeruginosa]